MPRRRVLSLHLCSSESDAQYNTVESFDEITAKKFEFWFAYSKSIRIKNIKETDFKCKWTKVSFETKGRKTHYSSIFFEYFLF